MSPKSLDYTKENVEQREGVGVAQGSSPKAKILVVEDEQDIRELVSEFLEENEYAVESVESLNSALLKINSLRFDLVIADIFLGPDRLGGIQILETVQPTGLPVVLISGNADMEALKKAINLGAKFFLEKPFDLDNLQKIIHEVLDDRGSMDSRLNSLAQEKSLTSREKEIFELVSKGLSNRDIATATGTSERTVKAHLSSIFKKSQVSSRSELLSLLLS